MHEIERKLSIWSQVRASTWQRNMCSQKITHETYKSTLNHIEKVNACKNTNSIYQECESRLEGVCFLDCYFNFFLVVAYESTKVFFCIKKHVEFVYFYNGVDHMVFSFIVELISLSIKLKGELQPWTESLKWLRSQQLKQSDTTANYSPAVIL